MSDHDKHSAKDRNVPAKRGPGQPKYVIPDASVPRVVQAIVQGTDQHSIARALKINYRTWMRVKEEDERIAAAFAEARQIEEDELVGLLMDKARAGDTTSIIFALKGRHGYRDQGAPQGVAEKVNVTINMPGAMPSMDDYMKTVVEADAKAADDE